MRLHKQIRPKLKQANKQRQSGARMVVPIISTLGRLGQEEHTFETNQHGLHMKLSIFKQQKSDLVIRRN